MGCLLHTPLFIAGCTVLVAPIAGSVLLHRCERSTFMLCARQLRIHTSTCACRARERRRARERVPLRTSDTLRAHV